MDEVLHGLSFVVIYLDDVLIHSTDVHQHADHLGQVLFRLQSSGLTLKGSKCHIGMFSRFIFRAHFFCKGDGSRPKQDSGNQGMAHTRECQSCTSIPGAYFILQTL